MLASTIGHIEYPVRFAYHTDVVPLSLENEIGDLDVIYDNQLSSIPHGDRVISKLLLRRSFQPLYKQKSFHFILKEL